MKTGQNQWTGSYRQLVGMQQLWQRRGARMDGLAFVPEDSPLTNIVQDPTTVHGYPGWSDGEYSS